MLVELGKKGRTTLGTSKKNLYMHQEHKNKNNK